MTRPLRIEYPGALYHVTNRGNERKPIFKDDADRLKFLEILAHSLEVYAVKLYSFVLMSNHFHLLVETPLGNLSQFMRHFNITYTSAFNRRHRRSGHLYQGRYKSFLVEKDAYLAMVSRYIHFNPVKVGGLKRKPIQEQLKYLWGYRWSSLPGYLWKKKRWDFVDYSVVLGEYGGDTGAVLRRYKEEMVADLSAGLPVRENVVGQSLLGSEDFVRRIQESYLEKGSVRELPALAEVRKYLSRDAILDVIGEVAGKSREEVLSQPGTLRQVSMDFLYRRGGLTNPEIGKMMSVDYCTVSQGRKRLVGMLAKDPELRLLHQDIERALSRIKI